MQPSYPGLEDFRRAATAIAGDAIRTPLLHFRASGGREIRLKAESLQPLGSFKIRAGANALATIPDPELAAGVATASAGNFAQGLALAAKRRNIPLTVHVPATAPAVKLDSIRSLGARIETHAFEKWWEIMSTCETGRADGRFIHPVCEPTVLLGNGTIGLELVEQWAEFDAVFVPVGGGGLLCGLALALRAMGSKARVVACEVETAAPLTASRRAGRPVSIERIPSFVDGIGGGSVFPQMWPLLQELVSDVPVGVLLSGGIDSSIVAAFTAEAREDEVRTFSVAYDEPSFDESHFARMVAGHLGTKHHELRLTSRMAAEVVPQIGDYLDEPFGDASFIPTYMLSRFAREHVKVVLGGDGSDELFAGYPTIGAHRLIEYYERVVPWHVRTYAAQRLLEYLPVSFDYFSRDFKIRRFLSGRGVPLEARHHRWLGSFVDEEKSRLFQDWLKPVLGETYARSYEHARACDARLPLNRILYNDMKLYLEGDILFKVDRASMAASLEVRVPFLNRRVVDFAAALPLELKLRRFTGKYLLRRAMDGLLPEAILKRSKQGFAMPVAHWLNSELRDLVHDMLAPERIRRQGLFDSEYVSSLLREHSSQQRDNRKLLWTLLVFQLWYARHVES